MALITHPATGFPVGDPDRLPLQRASLPSPAEIAAAMRPLILSTSGWRKVFAADGDEESPTADVSRADLVLAGAAALAFSRFLKSRASAPDADAAPDAAPDAARTPGASEAAPAVIVGVDSRPTGAAIADAMVRVLAGEGFTPRYLFIVAAPEIMAYSRECAARSPSSPDRAEGFVYVSASHNPRGHNGLKFGTAAAGGGGVMAGDDAAVLIGIYRELMADPAVAGKVLDAMEAGGRRAAARAFSECSAWKRRSVSAYTLFARRVVTDRSDPGAQEELLSDMADGAGRRPIGVVAELNGSARGLSIDKDFLEGMGVRTVFVNERPREFAHRIVPEGESLDLARKELEAAHAEDPSFVAAYVPDCDGDRGNLVRWSEAEGRSLALEAQEVFALCCVAELAQLVRAAGGAADGAAGVRDGAAGGGEGAALKPAIVVNDATSMRIEALARAFGAEVFRAETGEANVVGLAASLREKGYVVRILGEGSNGGNITHPSSVRDPLATLGALLKLLLLRDGPGGEGLFRAWTRLSGQTALYRPDFGLDDLVASLPRFATTSVFETRAALRVRSTDHAALKGRYGAIFAREWAARASELERRFGVVSWEALASRGKAETRIGADFAASGSGGLRILLKDARGSPRAFIWMRGSGTEPVFRVMADVEGGSPEDEAYLLDWHTSMVREADAS